MSTSEQVLLSSSSSSSTTTTLNYDQLIQSLIGKLSAGQKFMIYGCYGYTGELIVKLVKKFNLLNRVVLAGRSGEQIKSMMKRQQIEESAVEYQVFGLDDKNLDEQIGKVDLVMLVAGPFAHTSKRVVDSCLKTGVHYIDITGEYTVFQSILENEACKIAAKQKNIILMPGVGFDVVPTDCLAKSLQEAFDTKYGEGASRDAKAQIELAINTGKSGVSRGTTKSAVNMMKDAPWGFPERVNHKIVPSPLVAKDFEFLDEKTRQNKKLTCMSVSWGDIATGYVSTQVPNIRVYFTSSKNAPTIAKIYNIWFVTILFFLFFNLPFVVPILFKIIDRFMPKGPEESENDRVHISGCLTCGDKKVSGRAVTKAGYLFTAESTLLSALKILTNHDLKVSSGCLTPSLCFGADFVKQIDSCNVEIL